MLEVDEIHTYYGQSYVLQGVSLEVAPGEVVAVLGRNGVGKTTLIRSIAGFTPPRRGRVAFRGQEIRGMPPHAIARLGVGLVPQGRRVFRSLTVRETLELGVAVARSRRRGGGRWSMSRLYDAFPRLGERASHYSADLSGGEQQMLATARALATDPDLLLLDEPTEGLAPIRVAELEALLVRLKAEGVSMLLVEQQLAVAFRLADRIHLMSKGRFVYSGAAASLRQERATIHQYLGVE